MRMAKTDHDDPNGPTQLEWFKCMDCGWDRAILQGPPHTWPMSDCPRCGATDAWEPTQVDNEWPAEMTIADYLDGPEEDQEADWRSETAKKGNNRSRAMAKILWRAADINDTRPQAPIATNLLEIRELLSGLGFDEDEINDAMERFIKSGE